MDKKEIEFCVQELIKECRNLKIPVSRKIDSKITINKRARSRFAACRREKGIKGEIYRIEIGEMLLAADKKVVRTILAHELLHTCRGCYNHGTKWKEYAFKMNQTYGYKIKTTATYEELGLEAKKRKKDQLCDNVPEMWQKVLPTETLQIDYKYQPIQMSMWRKIKL